jgi:hypothetical protein
VAKHLTSVLAPISPSTAPEASRYTSHASAYSPAAASSICLVWRKLFVQPLGPEVERRRRVHHLVREKGQRAGVAGI